MQQVIKGKINPLLKEKINQCIEDGDIVLLRIIQDTKILNYKGFFIDVDFKNHWFKFMDIIVGTLHRPLEDIVEVRIITHGGAVMHPSFSKYYSTIDASSSEYSEGEDFNDFTFSNTFPKLNQYKRRKNAE